MPDRRTLFVNGKEIEVAVVGPLVTGALEITDDFGIHWRYLPAAERRQETQSEIALTVTEAAGPAVEIGPGAGADFRPEPKRRGRRK